MPALVHPEPKAAIILAFPSRAGARTMPPDQAEGTKPAALEATEVLNPPALMLREIGFAIAAPVIFILLLQSGLMLLHTL